MAVITIRNIPNPTKEALRIKAANAGVSLEQYLRTILQKASLEDSASENNIMEIAATYFSDVSAKEDLSDIFELPSRGSTREQAEFKG